MITTTNRFFRNVVFFPLLRFVSQYIQKDRFLFIPGPFLFNFHYAPESTEPDEWDKKPADDALRDKWQKQVFKFQAINKIISFRSLLISFT